MPVSVEIHFITVLLRKDALDRLPQPTQARLAARMRDSKEIGREDLNLLATDYMNPADAEATLELIREAGLQTVVGEGPTAVWGDAAVVDALTGPTLPVPWLEFSPGFAGPLRPNFGPGTHIVSLPTPKTLDDVPRAWLKGQPEGELAEVPFLIGDARWQQGDSYFMQKLG